MEPPDFKCTWHGTKAVAFLPRESPEYNGVVFYCQDCVDAYYQNLKHYLHWVDKPADVAFLMAFKLRHGGF